MFSDAPAVAPQDNPTIQARWGGASSEFPMSSSRFTRLVVGVALAGTAVALRAQGADTVRTIPPQPSVLQRFPTFPDSVTPVEETRAHRLPGGPGAARANVEVSIFTPHSLANFARRRPLAGYMEACFADERPGPAIGRTSGGTATGSNATALSAPWAGFDSATAGRAFLVLQIDSPILPQSSCEASRDAAVRAAGVQFLAPGAVAGAQNDIRAATVSFRGRSLSPVFSARTASVLVGPHGRVMAPTPGSVRLYFAPDAFQPDARGRFASGVVDVTTGDTKRRDSVVLPDSVLGDVWGEFTTWRLGQLRAASSMRELPRLRAPHDTAYRGAAALYAGGHAVEAAMEAARRRERSGGAPARPEDQWFADLLIGSVFLAHDDSVPGRVEYASALDRAPCLQLSAHHDFDRVLDELRPAGVRCTSVPLVRELAWGVAVPGGGQWVHGNRVGGAAVSVLTVGLFALALEQHLRAQSQFDAYRSAVPPADIGAMLDRANATERSASGDAIAAAGVWLMSAAVGLATEAWHAHWTGPQRHFEPPATVPGGR